jgi:hypothetical protein
MEKSGQLHTSVALPPAKKAPLPIRRLDGSQILYGHCVEKKQKSLSLPGIEPGRPAPNQVTILTEIYQLPY